MTITAKELADLRKLADTNEAGMVAIASMDIHALCNEIVKLHEALAEALDESTSHYTPGWDERAHELYRLIPT